MFTTFDEIKQYVNNTGSQSHLCICNTDLFDRTVEKGMYGFPHSGNMYTKSFWRSISSMFNIGPNDLIFLYRTTGKDSGCGEITGPYKIYAPNELASLFYERNSVDFPIRLPKKDTDCPARLLIENVLPNIYSINDKYGLIKKYESKQIWGYRHPAVMNIGAARKKSITSFSTKQTILLLNMLENCNHIVRNMPTQVPTADSIRHYEQLSKDHINEQFLLHKISVLAHKGVIDEALLYAYVVQGLCNKKCSYRERLIQDFSIINENRTIKQFVEICHNTMLEVIVSPHLQDELDILLQDADETIMLFWEFKVGAITDDAIKQTEKYIDLLESIFKGKKKIYANVIGSSICQSIRSSDIRSDAIQLVNFALNDDGTISFTRIDP